MMEKSGCVQLTREELEALKNLTEGNVTQLVKASSALDKIGLNIDEAKRILDSGEYRVVED